jgi:hypothetical protein
MARPRGRPFPPGVSGNPKGRPPGVKEEAARGLVRRLVLEAVQEGQAAVRATLRRMLKDPRTAVHVLELAAKLNGEIGREAEHPTGRRVTINMITNVDFNKLRGPQAMARIRPEHRALIPPMPDRHE